MCKIIASNAAKGISIAFISILGTVLGGNAYAQAVSASDFFKKEFQQKRTSYWRQKENKLFADMASREKFLLQLIQNITGELRDRGKRALRGNNLGFDLIEVSPEKLIQAYWQELQRLVEIHSETGQLRQKDAQRNYSLWQQEFKSLQEQVLASFEDRKLLKSLPESAHLIKLIQDYHDEIDSVLSTYGKLEKFSRLPETRTNQKLRQQTSLQKESIVQIFEHPGLAHSEAIINEYFEEILKIAAVMDELAKLHSATIGKSIEAVYAIEHAQRSIVASLDKRVLKLIGYANLAPGAGPSTSEFFKEWQALQYAQFFRDLAKYRIIKKSLLDSGSPDEIARMQDRDLEDALVNYSEGDYALAETQLNTLLEDYAYYSNNLDVAYFYRGETNFARLLQDQARDDYARVVEKFPNSEFMDESLFRLMQISEEKGETAAFYNYYHLFKSLLAFNEDLANDCHYLAASVYLQDSRFDEAEVALSLIPEESERHLKTRYLQGLILVNQDDYDGAIELYEEIARKGDAEFRSKALLQLGYLHYEAGQYEQALAYFNQVSPESEYVDRALLAASWANFNQKKYDKTVDYVNHLIKNYGSSETSYEAMVLSAHNKKMLNQNLPASRDLSFVANSRKALDLSKRYYAERDLIVSQLNDLNRLEEEVVEQQEQSMYNFISELRFKLENVLKRFEFHGTPDGIMYEELQKERKSILAQIDELEGIIAKAHANGNTDIARQAAQQRTRLVKALEVYQARPFSVDYFSDYPLAVNEGATRYRQEVQTKLLTESTQEKQKVLASLTTIEKLRHRLQSAPEHSAVGTDLAILETQLNELAVEASQVSSWFGENQIDLLETDFNSHADFSGFGLSNATFSAIDATEQKISGLSQNISTISSLIEEWQGELDQRELALKRQNEKLAKERHQGELEAEKRDKELYFRKKYFDESESEKTKSQSESEKKKDQGEVNNL